MGFHRGEKVEVASKQEGFKGSYYSAIIIEKLDDMQRYIVRYKTLLKEDESGPLEEIVEAEEVRPVPPDEIQTNRFSLNDYVDAYDNDGWWAGRIVRKVGFGYSIYFDITGDQIDYPLKRLRIHLEWAPGDEDTANWYWWHVHRSQASLSKPAHTLMGQKPRSIFI